MAAAKRNVWARKPVVGIRAKFAGRKTKATRKTIKSKRSPANARSLSSNSSAQQAWKNVKSFEQKLTLAERKLKAFKAQFAKKVKLLQSKIKAFELKQKQAANRDSLVRGWANKIVAEFDKPKATKRSRKSSSVKSRRSGYKASARRSTRTVGRRKAA